MASEVDTDFKHAARLGGLLSKGYSEDLLRLLVNYKDISASEAASRLDLHIRTAQEFLDGLAELGILERAEVVEKKRPYFRYSLKVPRITIDIDLADLYKNRRPEGRLAREIRERPDSGARFSTARYHQHFGGVVIWRGEGRDRQERRISLTEAQGKFLYHLPFPTAAHLPIAEIMGKAGVAPSHANEVLDIVDLLETCGVVEAREDSG